MEKYPEGQRYEALYAKYIHKRPVSELVDRAGDIQGKNVLDLCCGTGRIVKECVARGANMVVGVDGCPDMVDGLGKWLEENSPKSEVLIDNVESHLRLEGYRKVKYDVVFCRQAVNYWLNAKCADLLTDIISPGGKFVFNTFGNKPGVFPVVKEYNYDEHDFVEVHWQVDDMVHHVQVRDGLPPHMTCFRWISPEELFNLLGDYHLVVEGDGPTSIYICTRKN
jgi:SAM-dependent methyltransferase